VKQFGTRNGDGAVEKLERGQSLVKRQKSTENGFPKNKMRDGISLVAMKGLLQLDT
jgi:hypothetical protein